MKYQRILTILFLFSAMQIHAQLYEYFRPLVYQTTDGDSLNYRFLKPIEVQENMQYPLFVFLHGAGERGDDNRAQLIHVMPRFVSRDLRYKYPTFILAPQCPENIGWGDGTWDMQSSAGGLTLSSDPSIRQKMIMAVIDQMLEKYPIDPDRIYIGGLSMGGAGTWSMISHYPGRFAAAVPICGAGDVSASVRLTDIPIWVFHGADDPVVPASFSRAMARAIQAEGGNIILTEFEGIRHDSWEDAFGDDPFIYDWLFSQRKK